MLKDVVVVPTELTEITTGSGASVPEDVTVTGDTVVERNRVRVTAAVERV